MQRITDADLAVDVRLAAQPLTGLATDYDRLLAMVGEARFVLIGEATHGTHQFYRERAHITQRLIKEKGFAAVQAELPAQFDVVLHFDETRAVEPLERAAGWEKGDAKGDLPETYPSGV